MKRLTDKLAAWVITAAGITVIAAMFAMLALIVREAAPLFFPASQAVVGAIVLPATVATDNVVAVGVEADLHNQFRVAGFILKDGRAGFALDQPGFAGEIPLARLPDAPESTSIVAVQSDGNGSFSILWDDGTVSLYAMSADFPIGDDGIQQASPRFTRVFSDTIEDSPSVPPQYVLLRGDAARYRIVAIYADGTVVEKRRTPGRGLLGASKGVESVRSTRLDRGGAITAAALNDDGLLYLGTDQGVLVSIDLSGDADTTPAISITPVVRDRGAVTSLSFLTGGYALAVGDAQGTISVWFPRRENGAFRLRRSTGWDADGGGAVYDMAISGRDRGFVVLDESGALRWLYSTTGATLLSLPPSRPKAVAVAINERADTMATLHTDGTLRFHAMDSSFPEAGWAGFFKRLLYEGYETAAFVWQSTGSDASEPKLSLVPLIWGSIKAAVYALFFATPIALAAAVYISQFASPVWRARLKPAVEMLAAVPSVVIGFIAALWLAPLLERHLQFFVQHYPYDQRNSLVIAIAMGFAVIPTVFSLAEDAISAVPPSLSAASLALGASKWQTVIRVVLPTASPGIFTAVMLGLGRAVGETMIVLMAAGNTPIISLSPFNGMRTLSANIAVEMPEAPVGGTLYRTLFLCALILFVLTLVINSAAEVFRHRLRTRYGKV
ncbi:MAG: phosphate ABC transporter permease subunit PstC [Planctomycetaceae bacterium]|nr:phosphate ABC transporter permease subunit PstC [Planctomycetaceae bacterium]